MAEKVKRPYKQVKPIADKLIEKIAPYCKRSELAGSLRRKCKVVGDIEIVAIPLMILDMFGNPLSISKLEAAIRKWPVEMASNGKKYKKFYLTTKQRYVYQVDLFLQPDPKTWGVNFLLRTGPADFSKKMVTPKSKGGFMPEKYKISNARVWLRKESFLESPQVIDTPEEEDVFRLWEMEYIPPEDRGKRL